MNDLILNVDALEEANQPFEADLPRDALDEVLRTDPPTEFHANGAAHLTGKATKFGRKVLVQAKATIPLEGICKRCLKPVTLDEQVDLLRSYIPADQAQGQRERHGDDDDDHPAAASFDPGTADEEAYDGKQIDLKPAIREQILLQVPGPPLCDEACKGLCLKCGKNLNEGDCGCDRTVMDPRWTALKGLQLEKLEKKKEK